MEIGPAPANCHYRRCWCTWWIVPNKETRITNCTLCGVEKMRATTADFTAAGLTLIEAEQTPDVTPAVPVTNTKENPDDRLW